MTEYETKLLHQQVMFRIRNFLFIREVLILSMIFFLGATLIISDFLIVSDNLYPRAAELIKQFQFNLLYFESSVVDLGSFLSVQQLILFMMFISAMYFSAIRMIYLVRLRLRIYQIP